MAGYLGTKAVLLSTTTADVVGNAEIGGDLTVSGAFTSQGIDDNASATAMTLDASGNVGIGTSSPSYKADILSTNQYALRLNTTDVDGCFLAIQTNGTAKGYLGSSHHLAAGTPSEDDITLRAENNLQFTTGGGSERMRIDSSGNLLVGTTLQYSRFDVSAAIEVASFTNTSGTGNFRFRNSAGSTIGYIQWSGSSTSYVTSSDYRLKTDAQPMTGASARVQALNPVNFEWISTGERVDGFLAHEAQEVVPECVTGTKDAMRDEEYEVTPAVYEDVIIPAVLDEEGNEVEAERTEQRLVSEAVMGTRSVPDYQGIDQSKLVPLLTAALQEALTEIADLKARVTALEAV